MHEMQWVRIESENVVILMFWYFVLHPWHSPQYMLLVTQTHFRKQSHTRWHIEEKQKQGCLAKQLGTSMLSNIIWKNMIYHQDQEQDQVQDQDQDQEQEQEQEH